MQLVFTTQKKIESDGFKRTSLDLWSKAERDGTHSFFLWCQRCYSWLQIQSLDLERDDSITALCPCCNAKFHKILRKVSK